MSQPNQAESEFMIKLYPQIFCIELSLYSSETIKNMKNPIKTILNGFFKPVDCPLQSLFLLGRIYKRASFDLKDIQFLQVYKRIMFDQDIFESECSYTKAGLQQQKMSSQHQSIFQCIINFQSSNAVAKPQKKIEVQHDVCFTQIQFFSQNISVIEPQLSNEEQLAPESQQEQNAVCQKQSNKASCNNIASYIIKHCFRKILQSDFREEVESICHSENISYPEFVAYWKQQTKYFQKHFGVNSLLKMMKKNQSPYIQVVRYFMIIYLRYSYPLYVMGNNKGRKELYIENSVKLLYLIDASKEKYQRLTLMAQNGPKNR